MLWTIEPTTTVTEEENSLFTFNCKVQSFMHPRHCNTYLGKLSPQWKKHILRWKQASMSAFLLCLTNKQIAIISYNNVITNMYGKVQ